MFPKLVWQDVNIVLRGHFDPRIFQPAWFSSHDLISKEELDEVDIKLITNDISLFKVDWLELDIRKDRFQVTTNKEPYYERARDFVIDTFNLMRNIPLRSMGVNRRFSYQLESKEVWHALGHRLAPKDDWNDLVGSPGMVNLTMEGKRLDNHDGYIYTLIRPIHSIVNGVSIEINDHYDLSSETETDAIEYMKLLIDRWKASMKLGLNISEKIIRLGR